jgi:hypothetical protein
VKARQSPVAIVSSRIGASVTDRDNESAGVGNHPVPPNQCPMICPGWKSHASLEMARIEMNQISVRYGFIRARQLEGTYPGDPKEGVWDISANRVYFGWGMVDENKWPNCNADATDFLDQEPPGLDRVAKRHQIHHYERLRSSADAHAILKHSKINSSMLHGKQTPRRAGEILGAQLAFEVTREFVEAPRGHVTTPAPDAVVLGTHSVYLLEYSDKQNWLEFINSWGPGWGDNGRVLFPQVSSTSG